MICKNWVSENYPQKEAFLERNLWCWFVIAYLALMFDLLWSYTNVYSHYIYSIPSSMADSQIDLSGIQKVLTVRY